MDMHTPFCESAAGPQVRALGDEAAVFVPDSAACLCFAQAAGLGGGSGAHSWLPGAETPA